MARRRTAVDRVENRPAPKSPPPTTKTAPTKTPTVARKARLAARATQLPLSLDWSPADANTADANTADASADAATGSVDGAATGKTVAPITRGERTNAGRRFVAAEFFAGIGLVRLALEQAGIGVVFANDIDADKQRLYEQNFHAGDFLLGDIHKLESRRLPDCDLVTASFPCNDLSVAGLKKGLNAGQSSAFWGLIDLVRGMEARRPTVILLENVPGFLQSNDGQDFAQALQALNGLGYVVDAIMLDAARFVPQSRLRLFVVAKRGESNGAAKVAANGETATTAVESSPLRPRALVEFIAAHPEIRWELAELPPPPDASKPLRSVLEDLPDDDPAWWSPERTDYFMRQLSERHQAVAQKMIASARVSYGTAFRRVRKGRSMAELRTDGVAGCLRTPRGGSGRQILFKAGRGRRQVRLLTARECARLQGVPDSYKIDVPLSQALFGFGDAVCVPAVAWIAKNYLLPELRRRTERS